MRLQPQNAFRRKDFKMRAVRDKLCRTTPALEEISTIHWRFWENITNSTITSSFQLFESYNLTQMFFKNISFRRIEKKKKYRNHKNMSLLLIYNTLGFRDKDILMTGGALLVLMESESGRVRNYRLLQSSFHRVCNTA